MSKRFAIEDSGIPGCFQVCPLVFEDERGYFIKTFHRDICADMGLDFPMAEEYYTCSRQRVLRGLHFQVPPMEAAKLVCCLYGNVMDVAVDMRVGSPTYGEHRVFNLSGEKGTMVYIPEGIAHGYYVLSSSATVLYKAGQVFSPECDAGIHWSSAGIPWPDTEPIVSRRDQGLLPMAEFKNLFRYKG